MSAIYRSDYERERERDRDWDTRSSQYHRDRDTDRKAFNVKKIYRIPGRDTEEDRRDTLSVHGSGARSERDRSFEETRIIRRERTPEPEPRREPEVERSEIRIVREDRVREDRVREPEPRRIEREIRYEREPEPPRRVEREIHYERDYDRPEPRPYGYGDLERYTRSVDYYPRAEPPPQPIIIRQEPQQIIIQEAPRAPVVVPEIRSPPPEKEETDFQMIKRSEIRETERSEVGNNTQVSKRSKAKPEPEEDEEYYYERRVREVSRDPRDRDEYEDDSRYRRRREREVSPGDSISNIGGRRRYSSEESYDYVKREEYDDDETPRHRRHLAEGAIAGIGAAELLRHHRGKQGDDKSSRRSRVGKDVGAAALGAIGAEAVTRARSHYRSKSRRGSRYRDHSRSRSRSRSRDRSGERGGRHKHRKDKDRREKSRSRSRSKSRVRQIAGLGLGAAAVAAAAAYANKQRKANKAEDRPSRSSHRRDSPGPSENSLESSDARNPSHRNKRLAQAGLAGAAVAGLVERARSKSRGPRERSKSRVRQGLPIAAAGLGSAAIAGLYEKNKANKTEKEAEKEARRSERAQRRAHRSRSRSLPYNEGGRDLPPGASGAPGEAGLIEYGDQPVFSNNGVPDYYNRPASQQGYYPEDAMVPAAAAAGGAAYGAQARERSRSDSGDSEGRRRRRRHRRRKSDSGSRSRSRGHGTAALEGGAGGAGLTEHERRKQRKEEKRERRRREAAQQESYGQDPYAQQQYEQQPISPPPGAGYPPEGVAYHPQAGQPYYPPPPNAPYSPQQEYPGQGGATPGPQIHPDSNYGQAPQGGYVPPVADAYPASDNAPPYNPGSTGPRRADENVSIESFHNHPNDDAPMYDSNGAPFYYQPNANVHSNISLGEGVKTPRAASPPLRPGLTRRATSQPPHANKSVQFALDSPASPDLKSPKMKSKNRPRANTSSDKHDKGYSSDGTASPKRDRTYRRRHRDRPPSPTSSDSTEDLPPRFDDRGRKMSEEIQNPLFDKFDEFLGKGTTGKIVESLGLGGGASDDESRNGSGRGGARRKRRR